MRQRMRPDGKPFILLLSRWATPQGESVGEHSWYLRKKREGSLGTCRSRISLLAKARPHSLLVVNLPSTLDRDPTRRKPKNVREHAAFMGRQRNRDGLLLALSRDPAWSGSNVRTGGKPEPTSCTQHHMLVLRRKRSSAEGRTEPGKNTQTHTRGHTQNLPWVLRVPVSQLLKFLEPMKSRQGIPHIRIGTAVCLAVVGSG